MISLLYHEKGIPLRIAALCQSNIQILYLKHDIASIYILYHPDIAFIYKRVIAKSDT